MKVLDILIGIVVVLIVGTIGVGAYYAIFEKPVQQQTTPPASVSGRLVSYEASVCPIKMKYPNTWGPSEDADKKEVIFTSSDYRVVISCNPSQEQTFTAKSYKIGSVSILDEDFTRYVFFEDDEGIVVKGGFVVNNNVVLEGDGTEGYTLNGSRTIKIGGVDYVVTYEFPEGTRSITDDGKKAFDEYLADMDGIVESINE